MGRIEWAAITFTTWIIAEAIWWILTGYWGATVQEAMTVFTALLIAVLTCPDKQPVAPQSAPHSAKSDPGKGQAPETP